MPSQQSKLFDSKKVALLLLCDADLRNPMLKPMTRIAADLGLFSQLFGVSFLVCILEF